MVDGRVGGRVPVKVDGWVRSCMSGRAGGGNRDADMGYLEDGDSTMFSYGYDEVDEERNKGRIRGTCVASSWSVTLFWM